MTISGCTTYPENNQTSIIREISADKKKLYFYENIFTVGTEAGTVTLNWRDITRLRIVLAHHYKRVDSEQVWNIAVAEVPALLLAISPG